MAILHIEKLGGLGNFGGLHSRIRGRGQLDTKVLSAKELQTVDSLFQNQKQSAPTQAADSFRFRISRSTPSGNETVEIFEADVPAVLASCVKDEFA